LSFLDEAHSRGVLRADGAADDDARAHQRTRDRVLDRLLDAAVVRREVEVPVLIQP